jgi:hypothetical protein
MPSISGKRIVASTPAGNTGALCGGSIMPARESIADERAHVLPGNDVA